MISLRTGFGVRNPVLFPPLELPKSSNPVSISSKIPHLRFHWRLVAHDLEADGRVRADTASLDMLNRNSSPGLEIRIETASAGRISLRELRAVYR